MKYFKQFSIILTICFIAEIIKSALPDSIPIPAGIYAFCLLFICLTTKIIKLEKIKDAGKFMIDIMPLMFVCPTSGLLASFPALRPILIPVAVIIVVATVLTMVSTGWAAQGVINLRKIIEKKKSKEDK